MERRFWFWMAYAAAWGLMSLYYAAWDAVGYRMAFLTVLPMNICQNAVWALEGILLVRIAEHFPITSFDRRSLPAWIINLGSGLALAILGLTAAWFISLAFTDPRGRTVVLAAPWRSALGFAFNYLHSTILLMLAVLGGWHGFHLYRDLKRRELEKAQLESSLAQARNQNLLAQLQPHFLFNALNSISSLIHADPEAADRMVARLGDLLRLGMEAGPGQEVRLERELALAEGYLAIEKVRFGDRLEVTLDIPPSLAQARVPQFVLQPLVENAIRHGIAPRARPGRITIRASREGESLVLEVRDDGAGFDGLREGLGLRNTRERLRMLYHEDFRFDVFTVPDKGTAIVMRIPLRLA